MQVGQACAHITRLEQAGMKDDIALRARLITHLQKWSPDLERAQPVAETAAQGLQHIAEYKLRIERQREKELLEAEHDTRAATAAREAAAKEAERPAREVRKRAKEAELAAHRARAGAEEVAREQQRVAEAERLVRNLRAKEKAVAAHDATKNLHQCKTFPLESLPPPPQPRHPEGAVAYAHALQTCFLRECASTEQADLAELRIEAALEQQCMVLGAASVGFEISPAEVR